jgi:hypothetical protein
LLPEAFLLGEQGFQSCDFTLVGAVLLRGVTGVEFCEQLPFFDSFAATHRDAGNAAGKLGGNFRVVDGFQRTQRALKHFQRLRFGLGDRNQGRGRARLFFLRLLAAG